ncbi:MAG: L-fucose mutarotase [Ruminococcaceae bacterium]|nr:L-fucose mutarotase [Oscillospiraceae bacterium]
MLNKIPKILPPELVKIMMEMGHGDEIVVADGNFPSASVGQRVVRMDGHGVPEILTAMLELMPLDTYAQPVFLMAKTPGDTVETPIWDTYREIIAQHSDCEMEQIERFAFYERAKTAYAVIATGEKALYANIILKKGVVV